ncbi:amidase signature domain-containing protein [Tricladium varicosporioides]|nr:amidase signature domain-containing protein [Hymenoscyphus varicosporioides]
MITHTRLSDTHKMDSPKELPKQPSVKCLPTSIISIGELLYLVGAKSVASFDRPNIGMVASPSSPLPITVIEVDSSASITGVWLKSLIEKWLDLDDVFSIAFVENVVFQIPHSDKGPLTAAPQVDHDVSEAFSSLEGWSWYFWESNEKLASGPYFLWGSELHQAYRLHPDVCGAFVYGCVPSNEDPLSFSRIPTDLIPVPSRLYTPEPTSDKPLLGKRFAVKDIYDVRGLITGAGCKSYEATQSPADKNAIAVQELVDKGAIIIGKTKTVQFASGMSPRDWVDYQCPFNPRGDGFLDTDCSSSGSGAAIAAYEWLDCAIGSDTLGSMVFPASACGIFGLRPTQGSISSMGGLPVSAILDTPGNFSRGIDDLMKFASGWGDLSSLNESNDYLPKRVLIPAGRSQNYTFSQHLLFESFLQDVEQSTTIKFAEMDLECLWRLCGPLTITDRKLDDYLATTVAHIQLHDCYHNNLKFQSDFKEKHGYEPYVDPLIRYKWDLGSKLTDEDYNKACTEKAIFAEFLNNHLLTPGTILLLPIGNENVSYRDEYSGDIESQGQKWQGFGFMDTAFSVLGGGPSLSFPIGQRLYKSKISGREEYQPVSMWALGAIGTDLSLMKFVKHVLQARGPEYLKVKTGKALY